MYLRALFVLFALCQQAETGEPCEPGWAFDGGIRCVRMTVDKGTWGNAACERMDPAAEMYSMESNNVQERLGGLVEDGGEFWVGMRDAAPREGWEWQSPLADKAVKESQWAEARPDIDSSKTCAYLGGGTKMYCNYPTPAFTGGAPVICEEACATTLPVLCYYASGNGVTCDPPDVDWKFFDGNCYRLIDELTEGGVAAKQLCIDTTKGGNARASVTPLTDSQEGAVLQGLVASVDRAWVSAQRVSPNPGQAWTWIDALVTYPPKWYDSTDTTNQRGACAYIKGSADPHSMFAPCSSNTGELCSEHCDSEFRYLCQKKADNRPWPPEEYLPPIFPPTPTPTLTITASTSLTVTESLTDTFSLTESLTATLTATATVTPPPTPTEVPIDEDENPLIWVLLGLAALCAMLIVALLVFRHRRIAEAVPYNDVREIEQTTQIPLREYADDMGGDSDPDDSVPPSQCSDPHAYDPLEALTAPPELRYRFTSDDAPWVSDWAPRVANLTSTYNISPAQAIEALRECGGHAGLAGRFVEDRLLPHQCSDRRDV